MNDILLDVKDRGLRQTIAKFLFRDRLSGLHNRRWLAENAAELMAAGRIARYAALDLDKFSDVNLSLGEAKADRVLARFGRIIAEFSAAHGLEAVHLSGEEFCLLIGPDVKDVRALLDELRQKVQDELGARSLREDGIAGPEGKTLRITLSIGEARLRQSASPVELVFEAGERAEQSLKKAKDGGRNRVVMEND